MKRSQAANFGKQRKRERTQELKGAMNQATILSVNAGAAPNTVRVSLQWQGNHDISDFELQRLGKILMIQDETPNTGWAIIECSYAVPVAHSIPGSAIAEWRHALSPGEKIPLRPDLEVGVNFRKYVLRKRVRTAYITTLRHYDEARRRRKLFAGNHVCQQGTRRRSLKIKTY